MPRTYNQFEAFLLTLCFCPIYWTICQGLTTNLKPSFSLFGFVLSTVRYSKDLQPIRSLPSHSLLLSYLLDDMHRTYNQFEAFLFTLWLCPISLTILPRTYNQFEAILLILCLWPIHWTICQGHTTNLKPPFSLFALVLSTRRYAKDLLRLIY